MPRLNLSRSTFRIPGVPMWEFVILFFVFLSGIRGLLGASSAYLALGAFAPLWHVALLILPIVVFVGLMITTPNGIITSMSGYLGIGLGSICVYAGLAVAFANPWFMGSVTLFIFMTGCFLRFVQLYLQLGRIVKSLQLLEDRES